MEESEATKKIMTCLYFILKEEPQRNNTFASNNEMGNKLKLYLQRFVKKENNSHFGEDVLDHLTDSINKMIEAGIILCDLTDANSPVLIVKEKLIRHIARF